MQININPHHEALGNKLNANLASVYVDHLPGAAVLVAKGEEVILRGAYGLAHVEQFLPMSPNSVFRIGSLTKQFTAAAIMLLVQRGQLDLHDALHDHLPHYSVLGHGIRIAHLLNHTAGLPCYTDRPDFELFETQCLSPEQILALFENTPLLHPPGSQFSYSNSGYFLLGLVIEKVSGNSLAAFFEDQMFSPLGMHSTGIEGYATHYPIAGYTEEPDLQPALEIDMSLPFASGALVSTIDDLFLWEQHIAKSTLISMESWQKMCAPTPLKAGGQSEYGYGVENRQIHGIQVVDHDGGISGFNTYSARALDSDLFVCVLSNNDSGQPSTIDVGEMLLYYVSSSIDDTLDP